jgi:hypothetical protein
VVGEGLRVNVSAGIRGAQRRLPKAVALALLVGGTGGFVAQQHAAHERLDAEPLSASEPDAVPVETVPLYAPTVVDVTPQVAPGPALVRVAEPASRSVGVARHALPRLAAVERREERSPRLLPTGRHRRDGYPSWHSDDTDAATHHGTGELNWSALARCEAGGNPHAVDPSGRYGGLYQFDSGTWHSLGGSGRPQDASPSEQTARARKLYRQRGAAPWPACGRRAAG